MVIQDLPIQKMLKEITGIYRDAISRKPASLREIQECESRLWYARGMREVLQHTGLVTVGTSADMREQEQHIMEKLLAAAEEYTRGSGA